MEITENNEFNLNRPAVKRRQLQQIQFKKKSWISESDSMELDLVQVVIHRTSGWFQSIDQGNWSNT